ncbi:MAG: DNA mismatch repair endonuclease MutL [Opitutus sp.]|nr:DNA mismatch repair endonuclease MutL [Opitutus sp.]MCS6248070.1 DNA mismatch repair endonuclease MutL [Opitutus sp.]MCS6274650.1 DNA mismatch repair endonuclease MutL [Opitutus sp.]MCS6279080.1 DNA mismatch repair endonuclease MutL [Opitutus sp.]MCS6298585.1 DNA mismatch repair endonuclease MutL [Opitutus sp.]
MAKVRILSDRVANQIAAGEVIERPAAVVKELVENAIDAGATRVEVEFRHGGRSLMRIEDNGHGMSRDDALLALERHATSKINEADDLNRLASFGFRGEALPSIASVSRFTLQTREAAADVGSEILVNGGKFVHVHDCGRPVGTRIEVAQLFNSVPARRKFLKTDATEAAHIITGVRLYALAFPKVAFTLIEDGRVIFRSPECVDLMGRVAEIFGRQLAGELMPIDVAENGMRLSGLIGRPGAGRSTRHEMITFINQRPVDTKAINYALIESYHESLPKGRYPLAFVFFEIDPAAVDVNVHPSKREVRFRSETQVRGFIIRAVLARLRDWADSASRPAFNAAVEVDSPQAATRPPAATEAKPLPSGLQRLATPLIALPQPPRAAVAPSAPQPSAPLPQLRAQPEVARATPPAASSGPSLGATAGPKPSAPLAPATTTAVGGWRFLGVAHGTYALFETRAGLVLLDRRAAHERIWFERLQAQFRDGSVPSQRLLLPVPMELDPIASALLLDRLEFLNGHGFEVVEFGRNFFRIEGMPAWMAPGDAEPFVRELLGALRDGRLQESQIDVARDQLARLAAARAVRLGETVSEAAMLSLVGQLFACRAPLTSPGGTPTHIELSQGDLARRFQR